MTNTCTYIGPNHTRPGACTGTALEHSSYCAEHYAVVYKAGSGQRKRHKDQRKANAIRDIMSDFDAAVLELESEGFDFESTSEDPVALG